MNSNLIHDYLLADKPCECDDYIDFSNSDIIGFKIEDVSDKNYPNEVSVDIDVTFSYSKYPTSYHVSIKLIDLMEFMYNNK